MPAHLFAQDHPSLNDLAQLLALEDRREFDAGALRRAAQHPDSLVRIRAAMALGRIGERAGTPILIAMLADRDTATLVETVFALGELGDPAAVPELAALVDRLPQTGGGVFGVEVVTALCKIGGASAEATLLRWLDRHAAAPEGNDGTTAALLQEAWRLGPRSALARRLPDYARNARAEWRRNAVYAATRTRVVAAAPVLLEAAADGDALTRSYVARGLTAPLADSAGLRRQVFTAQLRTLVTDPEAAVRINALRSLATFADSGLAPLATARLADRDPNGVIQAATTLGALGGSRATAALIERLQSGGTMRSSGGTFGLRRALLTALVRAAPAQALAALRSWRDIPGGSEDSDWRERALWVEVLASANTGDVLPDLTAMLADTDPRVVAAALGALAQVTTRGDTLALARARAFLAHPDIGVRTAASGLLAREADPALVPDLVAAYRRAESDEDNDARVGAIDALGEIAATDAAAAAEVERAFLGGVPRSPHYLVRRAAAARLGEAAVRRTWGAVLPVETGRSHEEYREIVRRYVLPGARLPTATLETERGSIVLTLYGWEAPLTVDNFLRLADRHYFDNGRWHRVVPNFVVQDGDPRGDGSGGPGTTIRDEINRRRYDRGALGMALAGPDTGASQFFITHSPQPHLDGGYTVFGHVVSGWNTLDQVVQGDRIRRIFR